MLYEIFSASKFFQEIKSEEDARNLVWRSRFDGESFICPHCQKHEYYQHKSRPEVRECKGCHRQTRVRSGTIFEASKTQLLLWVRAIFYVMEGKRGVSASELQRHLEVKSYGLVWAMLHKIRKALAQRDEKYKLNQGVVELDGAVFGRRETGNQCEAIIAIESLDWKDEKTGKEKSRAGHAKVLVKKETKVHAQELVDKAIGPNSMVNTDGKFKNLDNVDHDYQVVSGQPEVCRRWLPWVHVFISNAKTWINGTHHGVKGKYLQNYLAEYTYRFNRRNDLNCMFDHALHACSIARPVRLHALC